MAEEEVVRCQLCDQPAEGYEHVRVAIFVNGAREFGPERVTVKPCGCISEFPEFFGEDDVADEEEGVYQSEVTVRDMIADKDIFRFKDIWQEEEWYVIDDGDSE